MKILIPLDGSEIGEAALPYVKKLLSDLSPRVKLEFTLLRVTSLQSHYVAVGDTVTPVAYTEGEMKQIKKRYLNYLRRVGKNLEAKGIIVETRVEVGNAAEEIIRTADEINADLIAMSTHGRSGISRWAFGSVTDKVLHGGHKPVLVVRAPKEKKLHKRSRLTSVSSRAEH